MAEVRRFLISDVVITERLRAVEEEQALTIARASLSAGLSIPLGPQHDCCKRGQVRAGTLCTVTQISIAQYQDAGRNGPPRIAAGLRSR